MNKIKSEMSDVGSSADKTSGKMKSLGLGKLGSLGAVGGIVTALGAVATGLLALGRGSIREMFDPSQTETPISSAFEQRRQAVEQRGAIERDIGRVDVFMNQIENEFEKLAAAQSDAGQSAQNAANSARIGWDDFVSDINKAWLTGFAPEGSMTGTIASTLTTNPLERLTGLSLTPQNMLWDKIIPFILGTNQATNKKDQEQSTPDGSGGWLEGAVDFFT